MGGGRGDEENNAVCFDRLLLIDFDRFSFFIPARHKGKVRGHAMFQGDGETKDGDDDDDDDEHKRDGYVFSEDHAVVMATSCVPGYRLNTARLELKKERKKMPTGGTDVGVADGGRSENMST